MLTLQEAGSSQVTINDSLQWKRIVPHSSSRDQYKLTTKKLVIFVGSTNILIRQPQPAVTYIQGMQVPGRTLIGNVLIS